MVDRVVSITNLDNCHRFKKPVKIKLEHENGYVVSSLRELVIWGEGKDEEAAVNDLKADILNFYESIADYPDSGLGRDIKKEKYWMLENIVGV